MSDHDHTHGRTLRHLVVHEFRHVEPGTRLEFQPRMNVLVGRNATGKTTLLNLISMALRVDFSDIENEPYHLAYRLERGVVTVDLEVKNRKVEFRKRFGRGSVEKYQVEATLEAEFRDTGETATGKLKDGRWWFKGLGYEGATPERQSPWGTISADVTDLLAAGSLPPEGRDNDPDRLVAEDRMDVHWDDLVRFDEALEFWKLILAEENDYDEDAECLLGKWHSYVPSELYQALKDSFEKSDEVSVTLHSANLPFLGRICNELGYEGARVRAELLGSDSRAKEKRVGNLFFWFKDGAGRWIPIDHLSFGEKRMFALLYYLSLNEDVAIVDEPTNGLHHAWAGMSLEEIRLRQSFVATQNPLWLCYLSFDSAKEVQETFIQCTNVPGGQAGARRWRWASLGEEGARRFFTASKKDCPFVSEFLKAQKPA